MDQAWQILRDAGLPLAAPSSGRRPAIAEVATAVRAVMGQPNPERDREALAALVLAWRQAWPTSFATTFVADAAAVETWAAAQLADDNRYLKLRRIALANLASLL